MCLGARIRGKGMGVLCSLAGPEIGAMFWMLPPGGANVVSHHERPVPGRVGRLGVACPAAWCDDARVSGAPSLPAESAPEGVSLPLAAALILLLAAVSWLPHLSNSLWLDETMSYWVIQDGFAESIDRAVHQQPQPAYYIFLWAWVQLFGTSEIALRIPSLLAMLGACFLLARLGSALLGDRESGCLAAIVFASSWSVFRESVDARSYALGLFVLLALTASLLRWLDSGGWRPAWLCGVLAALLPHLHLFFALVYPALAVYGILRFGSSPARRGEVGVVVACLATGALFYLPVALALAEHASSYSFAPSPDAHALFTIFVWPAPVVGLLIGFAAAGMLAARSVPPGGGARQGSAPIRASSLEVDRATGFLLALWVFLPLLLLFLFSTLSDASVFIRRYLIAAVPGVALLYAWALRGIPSARARMVAASLVVLTSFALHERPQDDFRTAALEVRSFLAAEGAAPVLLASGLIEGQDESWLRDPALSGYLNAPTDYYPMGERVIALPRKMRGQPLALEILESVMPAHSRFAVVEWTGNGADVLGWIAPRAARLGYRVERRNFGVVRVALFRRDF